MDEILSHTVKRRRQCDKRRKNTKKNVGDTIPQEDIEVEELRNEIQKIRNGKALGHVEEMMKALSNLGCEALLNLLNQS